MGPQSRPFGPNKDLRSEKGKGGVAAAAKATRALFAGKGTPTIPSNVDRSQADFSVAPSDGLPEIREISAKGGTTSIVQFFQNTRPAKVAVENDQKIIDVLTSMHEVPGNWIYEQKAEDEARREAVLRQEFDIYSLFSNSSKVKYNEESERQLDYEEKERQRDEQRSDKKHPPRTQNERDKRRSDQALTHIATRGGPEFAGIGKNDDGKPSNPTKSMSERFADAASSAAKDSHDATKSKTQRAQDRKAALREASNTAARVAKTAKEAKKTMKAAEKAADKAVKAMVKAAQKGVKGAGQKAENVKTALQNYKQAADDAAKAASNAAKKSKGKDPDAAASAAQEAARREKDLADKAKKLKEATDAAEPESDSKSKKEKKGGPNGEVPPDSKPEKSAVTPGPCEEKCDCETMKTAAGRNDVPCPPFWKCIECHRVFLDGPGKQVGAQKDPNEFDPKAPSRFGVAATPSDSHSASDARDGSAKRDVRAPDSEAGTSSSRRSDDEMTTAEDAEAAAAEKEVEQAVDDRMEALEDYITTFGTNAWNNFQRHREAIRELVRAMIALEEPPPDQIWTDRTHVTILTNDGRTALSQLAAFAKARINFTILTMVGAQFKFDAVLATLELLDTARAADKWRSSIKDLSPFFDARVANFVESGGSFAADVVSDKAFQDALEAQADAADFLGDGYYEHRKETFPPGTNARISKERERLKPTFNQIAVHLLTGGPDVPVEQRLLIFGINIALAFVTGAVSAAVRAAMKAEAFSAGFTTAAGYGVEAVGGLLSATTGASIKAGRVKGLSPEEALYAAGGAVLTTALAHFISGKLGASKQSVGPRASASRGGGSSVHGEAGEKVAVVPPNSTPTDLSRFGNTKAPREARPRVGNKGDVTVDAEGNVHPTGGKEGVSTFGDPSKSKLSGPYHNLPKGTELPEGLGVVADGSDVGGPHDPTHHTIYPTREMTFEEYRELIQGLPWYFGGNKPKPK